jgi:hypothetical protein
MPNILEYPLQTSLYSRVFVVCTHSIGQLSHRSTLQNFTYPKKHSAYYREVLKSKTNIQKSSRKLLKELDKYSIHLLFTMIPKLIHAVSNLNPVL